MSRILVVTPYPPTRDGIAAYAVQQVAALRAHGEDVTVLSPGPSAAHHHLALVGVRGALSLVRHIRRGRYDSVIIQFHPDFFYRAGASTRERAEISAALTVAFRAAKFVEVYVHEIDYRHGLGLRGWPMRTMWASADRIYMHTTTEREQFLSAFQVRPDRVQIADHGKDFQRHTQLGRTEARAQLGIDEDTFLFLSIGFIQEHKGFDRGVRAFRGLAEMGPNIYAIVGSVRVEEPAYVAYAAGLSRLVRDTPGAQLHDAFITDEMFDRWIVACDVVVLPYRAIWSSGVLERARLYERPVIASAVGGLVEQAGHTSDMRMVRDDVELRTAMWAAASASLPASEGARWADVFEAQSASQPASAALVQAQLEFRAEALRSAGVRHVNDQPGTTTVRWRASAHHGDVEDVTIAEIAERVRSLPWAVVAPPESRTSAGRLIKRVIAKLTRWQVAPVVDQMNALRSATADAVEQLERRR